MVKEEELVEVAPFNVNQLQEYLKAYKKELGKLHRIQGALDKIVATNADVDSFNIQVNLIVPNKNQIKPMPLDLGFGPIIEMVPKDRKMAAPFRDTALEQLFGQAIDGFQVVEILTYLYRQQQNTVAGFEAAFQAAGLEY